MRAKSTGEAGGRDQREDGLTIPEAEPQAPRANPAATLNRPRLSALAANAALVMAFYVASRVLGLVREMVISHQFGTSRALDAYRAAFTIPDLIFTLVAGGALGSAFIPTFTAYLAREEHKEAWRLASAVTNLAFLTLSGAAIVVGLLAPWLVPLIVPGFVGDEASLTLTTDLVRIMLASPMLAGMSGIFMGVLNSRGHFLAPAVAPVVYNLGIIGGAVFLAPSEGVRGLAIGVAVGAALHLLIQIPALWQTRPHYSFTLGLDLAGTREVGRLMLPRVMGLAAMQLNYLVNTILASTLRAGSLAALTFAWQLTTLPWGVFAMSISTVSFPSLSASAARGEMDGLKHTLSSALRTIIYLTLPAGVGLFVLREPLVALLFQRGEFTAESTLSVAWALAFYAPGLLALAVTEILTRAFYALHDTRTPVLIAVATVAANVAMSLLLLGPLSHGGLALAATISNTAETIILIALLRRRLGGLDDRNVLISSARAAVASLIMGLALATGWNALAAGMDVRQPVILLAALSLTIALGSCLYVAATMLAGATEPDALRRFIPLPRFRTRRRFMSRPYRHRRW